MATHNCFPEPVCGEGVPVEFKLMRDEELPPGYGLPAAGVPGVTAGVRPPPLEGVRETAERLLDPCTGVPGTVRTPADRRSI